MRGEIRNIIKVSSVYLAVIIGAGFASGQEIIHFFTSYGKGGFYGILLSGALFAFSGYIILEKVYLERVRNFEELIFPIAGLLLGRIMQLISTIFLLSVYCVMIAGMGSILSGLFHLPLEYGIIIISIISMIIMFVGVEGIAALSAVLAPVLVVGIIGVGFFIIISRNKEVFSIIRGVEIITNNWVFSSLLYVSYNNILAASALSSLLPYLKTRRTAIAGGILGGLLLCFTALVLNLAISTFFTDTLIGEFPVIDIIERYSSFIMNAYNIVMASAMLTSAVTSGYGAICRISTRLNLNIKTTTVVICALSVPLSSVGFSRLISTVYPIFGYTGMFMLFLLVFDWINRAIRTSA
ncbi:MAG: hypothetical protein HPY74_04935 [Firmicutes bacterium]|nr:hypothetical protein [Bacillota bacterium]